MKTIERNKNASTIIDEVANTRCDVNRGSRSCNYERTDGLSSCVSRKEAPAAGEDTQRLDAANLSGAKTNQRHNVIDVVSRENRTQKSMVAMRPHTAICTKMKFTTSDVTGATVGFVSQNTKTGEFRGVRQNDPHPKKICIVDRKLACDILQNTLYDVTLVPMNEKDGYVVIEATPVQFHAEVATTYIPKAIYRICVRFGNKKIQFDPKDGRKDTVKNLVKCRRLLETRVDLKNLNEVVEDFDEASRNLLKRYKSDGFLYRD